jgi:hypothetical protein
MLKFFLNLLVKISKALVYAKIKFYSEKNFPRHFRPIRPFGPATALSLFFPTGRFSHPHGPTGHLLPPPAPEPSAPGAAGRPRAATRVDPTPPPEEKKMAASIPFIPPLLDAVSPSSITGNWRVQRRPLKPLQRRPLKTLSLASAL